jgi:hypothetical protein
MADDNNNKRDAFSYLMFSCYALFLAGAIIGILVTTALLKSL